MENGKGSSPSRTFSFGDHGNPKLQQKCCHRPKCVVLLPPVPGHSGNNYLLIVMNLTGKWRGLIPPSEKVGGEGLSHFLGNEPLKKKHDTSACAFH